jgi:hypothetical protein
MVLRVIGAGLPRTGTSSLNLALQHLLGGKGYHMTVIAGHPFNLGDEWDNALADMMPDWDTIFDGFSSAVDWPTSMFWQEISATYPDAPIILSTRDSAETWVASLEATILPVAREALVSDWSEGRGLLTLLSVLQVRRNGITMRCSKRNMQNTMPKCEDLHPKIALLIGVQQMVGSLCARRWIYLYPKCRSRMSTNVRIGVKSPREIGV